MASPLHKNDNILTYYNQIKQRIDLNIDMNSQKVIGQTKLAFILNNEINEEIPELLFLYLNSENIYINNIKIEKEKEKNKTKKINDKYYIDLEYKNSSPYHYYKNYLDQLYGNIEEMESFKNINRVEWEIKQKGNLKITIPKKYIIESSDSLKNKNNDNFNKNYNKKENKNLLINKIKIIINYEIIEKSIGIIFQQFYESSIDMQYKVCYTPNFYCNTQYWVPCIYNLNLIINWSLYIYIPNDYMAYSSCLLYQIIKDINGKKLVISKTNEPTTARNIGFIIINDDKIFKRYYDQNNKNFIIVANKNKKEKIEKNLINNKLIGTLYNFYDEFFDINENNLKTNYNCITSIIFIPYILFNYPFVGFNKFLKAKEENYLNFIKFPYLYILPEKYIYNKSIPEMSNFQLRNISKIFINNYIGGLIIEKSYADFWIINGIESWLSNLFLNKVFDNYYIKSKLYKWLLKLKKFCKTGQETLPLYTNNFSHPIDMQINPIFDLKSKILFHLLETQVEKTFIQKALRNIINERNKKGYIISTEYLIKIFKKNCGINLKYFMDLYVYKTGMFEINLNYIYNQKTNSIDINIHQDQIAKKYYENNPFFNIKDINLDFLKKTGKNIQVIDYRTKPNRYLNILLNINIFQTNGIEIERDSQKIKLISGKDNYYQNFPLTTKFRKIKLKKREQEFMQDLINNTGINKIYSNEEIEKILSQNSILWLRFDSELSSLSINRINQQHILYEYIKIFREGDYFGQMESLYNIGKDKNNYENSLEILKILIESHNIYYKIKQYALKIYVKILLKLNKEEKYQFLLEMLDNCYNELLKNKLNLNLEIYYIMKDIIKYLGEYKETNFRQFSKIGLVTNSEMQNKIINKFLGILLSNELSIINGFDDCYIMAQILINTSKLNLQEKSIIFLEIILKNLRIEKLRRSDNEIIIISSLFSLINLLNKNEFFFFKKNIKFKIILSQIFNEVNFYINNDTENYELNVLLQYFQIFMIFYRSHSFIEFSNHLIKFVLGEEYNNTAKMAYFSIKKNLDMISKIKALNYLFENNIIYFDSSEEKIVFLTSLKIILYSPICYLRVDCRKILENIYEKFYNKDINEIGAGNNNFNNINFLHILNKNWINYSSKKYADEDWLYNFINEDKILSDSEGDESINEDEDNNNNDMNEEINKYRMKYKNDEYALLNTEINLDNSFNDILLEIVDKLLKHPLSQPFSYPLNKETLNDLYEDYIQIISTPIDLYSIRNNILNNYYNNFISFNNDINLMFNNCKIFNKKGSLIYNNGIQLQEYYKIIIYPIKNKNNFNNDNNELKNNNNINIENYNTKELYINTLNEKYNINDIDKLNNFMKDKSNLNINNNNNYNVLNKKRSHEKKIVFKNNQKNNTNINNNNNFNENNINIKENE